MTYSKKFKHFLMPKSQQEVAAEVEDTYAKYNIAPNTFTTSLAQMRSVNDMLLDPIISSAVALQMETAFQMNEDQHLFSIQTKFDSIRDELEDFHRDLDIDNFILTLGYNLIVWGNLPIKKIFDKEKRLIGATLIGDFTSVTPIIISGILAGFIDNEGYHFPFEYYYAQSQHYKNLGGPYSSASSYVTMGEKAVLNEFVYAPSYLSSASKPWRNVNIIEDALLLARMDQSNYYRIISVDVPGSVYSKPAIQTLNYYRNIFKKVRRVSYDPAGMSSRGANQEFEVIVPKSGTSGVSVENVGGDLDIKALKDLDTQYSRLFAALRVNPSQIGFDSDTPGTLNGEGPGLLWDERFAKLCRALLHSTFQAVRDLDYTYLRSRGYSVSMDDWHYNIPALSLMNDKHRAELLASSVETLEKLTRQFKDNELAFNKEYLFTAVLGNALSLSGVDMKTLFDTDKGKEIKQISSSRYLHASDCLTEAQKKVLLANGLLENDFSESKTQMITSHKGQVPVSSILYGQKIYASDIEVDVTSNIYSSDTESSSLKSKETESFVTVPLPKALCATKEVDTSFKVSDVVNSTIGCIDDLYLVGDMAFVTSREDIQTYFALLSSGNMSCVVSRLHHC